MINLATNPRDLAGTRITTLINAGSNKTRGYLEIRTGDKPSTPQNDATGTLLATLQFSRPAFGTFNNGVAISNPISSGTAVAAGVATWFRIYNRDNAAIMDGDITIIGQGGDIELNDVKVSIGETISITSLNAIMPQSN